MYVCVHVYICIYTVCICVYIYVLENIKQSNPLKSLCLDIRVYKWEPNEKSNMYVIILVQWENMLNQRITSK